TVSVGETASMAIDRGPGMSIMPDRRSCCLIEEEKMRPAAIVALLLSFPVAGLAIAASAQAPAPPSAQLDAMKKLDWMVGQWKGEARIEFAPGQQRTLTQTETVKSKLGGLVLLIEGSGTMKLPGREEEVPVFGALTAVSYDEKAKRYRWLAHT